MRIPPSLLTTTAFVTAGLVAIVTAWTGTQALESRSEAAVRSALLAQGITWAEVRASGLQLRLIGTAPNEATRFRVLNLASTVVDSARLRDRMTVAPVKDLEPPRFSVEMLRNTDGISLIGLLPEVLPAADAPAPAADDTPAPLAAEIAAVAGDLPVSDMLETANFPAPEGWAAALKFGTEALKLLPRSKISVAADQVAIIAITDSDAQKRRLEAELAKIRPAGLAVSIELSAPRPVLTPFTLRFLKDEEGARFDACSADTNRARDRILAAGKAAGVEGTVVCTVGLGVPTPSWAEATAAGIAAVSELGGGSVTFSDADVTLLAAPGTPQATFDHVVGELQTALPQVFSLQATLPAAATPVAQGPAEFTARLAEDGRLQLRGRLTDELLKTAVDSYARAKFGADQVYTATRFDPELPDGWPIRVLAGLEALAELHHGSLTVRADSVQLTGITGNTQGRARVSQILSDKLGQGKPFSVSVRYDEAFDPLAALPSPQECAADLNAILARGKITFAPGSAEIAAEAGPTMEALAEILKACPVLPLEIAGHTDAQGSTEGNLALSQARAESVRLSLQGRGAPVDAIQAKGYGEGTPIADNGTEEGREANRRIEFTLLASALPAAAATDEPQDEAADETPQEAAPDTTASDTPPDAAPAEEAPADPAPEVQAAPAEDAPAADPEPPAAANPPAADAPHDFSGDLSPSVAPTEMTLRPRARPARED